MEHMMHNQTVLITGGTGGIGKATAISLAKLGAHVLVVGRDHERGTAAIADIKRDSGNEGVDLLLVDLSSQAEIRRLARDVQARYDRLNVLLNNVGGLYAKRQETVDGIEANLTMNLLGPFLLTQLLLPLLQGSSPSRIINVSGGMPGGKLDVENLQGEHTYSSFTRYSQTKLANLVWTWELARRLHGTGVTVNALYPGSADTAMTQGMIAEAPAIFKVIGPLLRKSGGVGGPPANAALSSIRAASDPALADVTGRYFGPSGKEGKPPRGSTDAAIAPYVWALCEQLTPPTRVEHYALTV